MTENDQHESDIVRSEERLTGGSIEAWRRADSDQWFLRWLPDIDSPSDYPGHTFTSDEAGVANDRDELLAWARKKFGE